MCGVGLLLNDLYRSKEIQLAKSHSLMIFMRTRHLNHPPTFLGWGLRLLVLEPRHDVINFIIIMM